MTITRETSIEELVSGFPPSVRYLMERGIKCIACGEPIWGSLESAAREKGFSDQEIDTFVLELSAMADPASSEDNPKRQS